MLITSANIILEGCDCVGKSTLAKLLQRMNPSLKITHYAAPASKESAQRDYEHAVDLLNMSSGHIFDRCMLGECVYGPVYRNYYPVYMRDLEKKLEPHTVLFLIQADAGEVEKRFDGKFIAKNDIPRLLTLFRSEFHQSKYTNKFIIDTTFQSPEASADLIQKIITDLPLHCISSDRTYS